MAEPLTRVPPPADDPVARLGHVLRAIEPFAGMFLDHERAVTVTVDGFGEMSHPVLTWGDLRALHAELTACAYCLKPGCADDCGSALDQPIALERNGTRRWVGRPVQAAAGEPYCGSCGLPLPCAHFTLAPARPGDDPKETP
jgi:hypothetical protein